mgnify:CR=1 FL=1
MQDLSITQEYYICAVNEKGRISDFSTERLVCFVAAGLLDLQLEGCLSLDKKNVTVTGSLPAGRAYLTEKGTMKPEKVMEAYTYSLSDKHIDALMGSVGTSLEEMGLAQALKAGLFGSKTAFAPSKEAINRVVDMVRSELLEDGTVTDEVAALTALLDKSGCLKEYFSKFEQKEIKQRLKEIAASPNGRLVGEMVEYIYNMIATMTVLTTMMH